MRIRRLLAMLLLGVLLPAVVAAAPGARPARETEATALVARARRHLASGRIEGRRLAIDELERSTLLRPADVEAHLLLARAYFDAGFLRKAGQRYERAAVLAPGDAESRFGLASVWRKDWLHFVDSTSLIRAVDHLRACMALDSSRRDAALMLASLSLERRDPGGARRAAERALSLAPGDAACLAALGAARWRCGDAESADSAFRAALPRLAPAIRERFEDLAPLVTEADTLLYNHLDAPGQLEYARRFWARSDPDLSTELNEAQLEYWSRVAQAWLLWYDPKHHEWDERGEVYVRYGPPERVDYNPTDVLLWARSGPLTPQMFPMNVQVWEYPSLGMAVTLEDRVLTSYYLLPRSSFTDNDPRPDPDSLAARLALSTVGQRAVFPVLPPGVAVLSMTAALARFASPVGARLLASLETGALPSDSVAATIVVLDSTAHVVWRTAREASPSACAPERARVADFAHELPPGEYVVALSARARAGRATARFEVTIPAPNRALAISDVVVTCGTPASPGPEVRLEANPGARVAAGAPLTAYFEIGPLATGADGQAHFEYDYRVRADYPDERFWLQKFLVRRPTPPIIQAHRSEDFPGTLRRQFVSVPVETLPAGRYRLEVRVRDLVRDEEVRADATFHKDAAAAPAPGGAEGGR